MVAVRAVYENGHLRLLDPVELAEGQQVMVQIDPTDEREILKAILSDMVRWSNPDDDTDAWVEDMAEEIDKGLQGEPPLSQIIIDDRGEW
jgi:predicted DNA-binding antitoxin AbrB/MazE fold protein